MDMDIDMELNSRCIEAHSALFAKNRQSFLQVRDEEDEDDEADKGQEHQGGRGPQLCRDIHCLQLSNGKDEELVKL